MKLPPFGTTSVFLAAFLLALSSPVRAASIFWDGTGTSWNSLSSWSTVITGTTDPLAIPGSADTATFNINGVNALQTVTLDANQSALGLSFNLNATGGVTLTGGGTDRTLTLGTGGIGINAATGPVTIGSATPGQGVSLILTGNQSWANNGSSLLTINNGVTSSASSTITLGGSGSGGVTVNGIISGGANTLLTINNGSAGILTTLTAANTYTGATAITKGTLVLSGANGALANTTTTIGNGGSLILDDRGVASANGNRLGTSGITLNNGSVFKYLGSDQAATSSTETIGAIATGSGLTTITVSYGGSNAASVTASSITRTATTGGLAFINGANLGAGLAADGSVGQFFTSAAPTTVGTTLGTSTGINSSVKNTAIALFRLGESGTASGQNGTATGTANTFLTYNSTNGYRPLNPTDEFTNNAITAGNNTYLTTGTTTAGSTAAINSLVVNGGNLAISSGQTLTDTSGMLLFAQNGSISGPGTFTLGGASNQEGIIALNAGVNATISSILTTGTTGLTIYGGGATLTLAGANTYGGTTNLQALTTVVAGNDSAFGTSTVTFGNATIKTDSQPRTLNNKFSVSGTGTFGGAGNLTLTGATAIGFNANSNAFLSITNTGLTTISGGFSLFNSTSGFYNNNGEGISVGSSSNVAITGAITDNNNGNNGSAATGSLLTLKFAGTGSNISLTPTAANNGFGGNSNAVNVVNGATSSSYAGYNTITVDGPGTNITPFGLVGLTTNTNAAALAFLQAASAGKVLTNNISNGASVGSLSGFGFAGVNDLTLGGNYTSGSSTGGAAFFNLATATFTFAATVSQNTGTSASLFNIIGPGNTTFSSTSSLTATSATTVGSLGKIGTGTLTLAGSNTLLGSTNLLGGTVVLDYTASNASRLTAGTTASALTLGGVNLQLKGGSQAQTLGAGGGTTLAFGQSKITQTSGGTSTIALGGLTRNAGSAIDFQTGVASTTSTGASGILGGYATVNGTDWATGGGAIAALGSYDSFATPGTNKNVLQADGATVAASTTINSLKITTSLDSQALAIGSGQILTLSSGGLLFTGGNDYSISGGTLKSATATASDLIIQQYGAGLLTIDSVIANGTGASTLTKAGTGTLALTASNTYTGATYIDGGILKIGADNNLGASLVAAINLNGGTLETTTGFSSTRTVGLGANGGTFQVDTGTLTLSGVVSSTNSYGGLTKTGAGTLLLTAANTFKGAIGINQGTLKLGNDAALGTSAATTSQSMSPITVNGGTLDIAGFAPNVGNVTLANGSIIDSAGTGSIAAYGFTLQSGTVSAAMADMTIVGNTNNAINVYKTTAGAVILSGVNTYTGNTTISGGKLTVSSTGSINGSAGVFIGAGEFNYNSSTALNAPLSFTSTGGKLSGNGTISSAVTITAGNTLAPGNSTGLLSFGSTLALATGSATDLEVGGNTTPGSDYDKIAVADQITFGGALTLTAYDLGGGLYNFSQPSTLDLFSFASEIGNFSSVSVFGTALSYDAGTSTWSASGINGYDYNFALATGDLITTASVPEPAAYALLAGVAILGSSLRRRRRAQA